MVRQAYHERMGPPTPFVLSLSKDESIDAYRPFHPFGVRVTTRMVGSLEKGHSQGAERPPVLSLREGKNLSATVEILHSAQNDDPAAFSSFGVRAQAPMWDRFENSLETVIARPEAEAISVRRGYRGGRDCFAPLAMMNTAYFHLSWVPAATGICDSSENARLLFSSP